MFDDVVAIHESGHVFMAVSLGLALRSVQVGENPRFDFAATPEPIRRLDHARVLMAGCEAERVVFDHEPIGGGSDDPKIAQLLTADDDEHALRAQVRRFVALNKGTILYLAAKLQRHGALDGDEVAAVVRGTRD